MLCGHARCLRADRRRLGAGGHGARGAAGSPPRSARRPRRFSQLRLRRQGMRVEFGEPLQIATVAGRGDELCRERGASSARILRADPSLVPYIQLGGWFAGGWKLRAARRATHRFMTQGLLAPSGLLGVRALELVLQAAFWTGVRSGAASRRELAAAHPQLLHRALLPPDRAGTMTSAWTCRRGSSMPSCGCSGCFASCSVAGSADRLSLEPDAVLPGAVTWSRLTTASSTRCSRCPRPTGTRRSSLPHPARRRPGAVGAAAPARRLGRAAAAAAEGVAVGSHTRTHAVLAGPTAGPARRRARGFAHGPRAPVPEPLPALAYPYGREAAATRAAAAAGYRPPIRPHRVAMARAPTLSAEPYRRQAMGTVAFLSLEGDHRRASAAPWERWRYSLHARGLTASGAAASRRR